MSTFIHQVEMKLSEAETPERLRRIDSWCTDWEISFRVLDRMPGSGTVRIAFEEARFARALSNHFGGVIVSQSEMDEAFAADAADEDAYDRLAHEFND